MSKSLRSFWICAHFSSVKLAVEFKYSTIWSLEEVVLASSCTSTLRILMPVTLFPRHLLVPRTHIILRSTLWVLWDFVNNTPFLSTGEWRPEITIIVWYILMSLWIVAVCLFVKLISILFSITPTNPSQPNAQRHPHPEWGHNTANIGTLLPIINTRNILIDNFSCKVFIWTLKIVTIS